MQKNLILFLFFSFFLCGIYGATVHTFDFEIKVGVTSKNFKVAKKSVEIKCKTTCKPHKITKTYTITLYRKGFFGSSRIGTATLSRNATETCKFTNVGSGTYYFVVSKANDGITMTGKGIVSDY